MGHDRTLLLFPCLGVWIRSGSLIFHASVNIRLWVGIRVPVSTCICEYMEPIGWGMPGRCSLSAVLQLNPVVASDRPYSIRHMQGMLQQYWSYIANSLVMSASSPQLVHYIKLLLLLLLCWCRESQIFVSKVLFIHLLVLSLCFISTKKWCDSVMQKLYKIYSLCVSVVCTDEKWGACTPSHNFSVPTCAFGEICIFY